MFCTASLSLQAQFVLNGTAITLNDTCYQLTSANDWEVGSIWNEEKVDLTKSFEVLVDVFLGCEDGQGADGIVFGLQPVSTAIGAAGEALGLGGVQPSLGVEFDTHENTNLADPTFDHIAIIRDGVLNHAAPQGSLAGPVQANSSNPNVEDCVYHPLRITWDAEAQTLMVYFDCELRLSYTGDIVNSVFDGDPLVFWGFTSATGGLNNLHEVCFSYITFLNELVDTTICPGEEVPLSATGGVSYAWSPVEGLSDPNIANPIATPLETTTYTVEVTDNCGLTFTDDVLITVDNDQFTLNLATDPADLTEVPPCIELVLNSSITAPEESTYTYSWSSLIGSTFADSEADSTVALTSLTEIGTETLTVQAVSAEGCVQEASVTFEISTELYDIPDIFSPNGDGTNDGFGVFTRMKFSEFDLKVYNRWGEKVYETSDQAAFWDGQFNDKPAPSDVYLYMIKFEVSDVQIEREGQLTLVR